MYELTNIQLKKNESFEGIFISYRNYKIKDYWHRNYILYSNNNFYILKSNWWLDAILDNILKIYETVKEEDKSYLVLQIKNIGTTEKGLDKFQVKFSFTADKKTSTAGFVSNPRPSDDNAPDDLPF